MKTVFDGYSIWHVVHSYSGQPPAGRAVIPNGLYAFVYAQVQQRIPKFRERSLLGFRAPGVRLAMFFS